MTVSASEPIGSGPWMYAEHSVGDYFRYEAFDKSHRGIPHYANLSLLLVPEESTKLAMVRTGQADLIDLVPESAPEVEAAGAQLTVIEGVGMFIYQFWGLYWPEAEALPIGDIRVRQAMSLAINRQDIIDYTLNGFWTTLYALRHLPHQRGTSTFPVGKSGAKKPWCTIRTEPKLCLQKPGMPTGLKSPSGAPTSPALRT